MFECFPKIYFGKKLIYRNQDLKEIALGVDADSLLVLEEMVVPALSQTLPRSGLPASTAGVAAGPPGRPGSPTWSDQIKF